MFFRKGKKEETKREETSNLPPAQTQLPAPVQEVQVERTASLFVKVEKYNELLAKLEELRSLTKGLRKSSAVFSGLSSTLNEFEKLLSTTLNRTERILVELESLLVRPSGLEAVPAPRTEGIDALLERLNEELKTLKEELEKTKSGIFAMD